MRAQASLLVRPAPSLPPTYYYRVPGPYLHVVPGPGPVPGTPGPVPGPAGKGPGPVREVLALRDSGDCVYKTGTASRTLRTQCRDAG